jgi:hypothetical protein
MDHELVHLTVLAGLERYLDDILVFLETRRTHLKSRESVNKTSGMKLNHRTKILKHETRILRHIVEVGKFE